MKATADDMLSVTEVTRFSFLFRVSKLFVEKKCKCFISSICIFLTKFSKAFYRGFLEFPIVL